MVPRALLRDRTLKSPAWTHALHIKTEMTHLFGRGPLLWKGLSCMDHKQPLVHELIDSHTFILQKVRPCVLRRIDL